MATQAEIKDWKTLQGIPQADFQTALGEGKYDNFLNDQEFVKAIKENTLFNKPKEDVKPALDTPPASPAPVVASSTPTVPPVEDGNAAPGKDSRKLWERDGFASEEEFYESVKSLRSIVDEKQKLIDRYNGERGKEGRRIKEMEEALKKERQERERLQAVTVNPVAGPVIDVPIAPVAPIPLDGNYDTPEFRAKVEAYQKDVQSYNEKMRAITHEIRQENARLKNEIGEVRTKASTIDTIQQENTQERQQRYAAEQWNTVMTEVNKLQAHDQDLATSKPFEDINNFIRTHGYEEAAKIYPKKDIENFDRICDVIKSYRNVDENGNVDLTSEPRYKNMKSAYYDMLESKGELDKFLLKVKTQGAKEGREQVIKAIQDQGNHARTLPIGASSADIVNEITDANIDDQLKEFGKAEYDSRLRTDVGLQKQVYDLMLRKAEKDPSWLSMIPTAWRVKFEKKG